MMNPNLSPVEWQSRFEQQARWTQELRQYLYRRANLAKAAQVIDVGCGTGALLPELSNTVQGSVIGLDIDAVFLTMAMRNRPKSSCVLGDAHQLPFAAGTFEAAICHFVLLWVADPALVLTEMKRVTRPGGAILALAEPDYGGRIDYPRELEQLGHWQAESLVRQGADPLIGRRLAELFSRIGLQSIEVGILGGQWSIRHNSQDLETEWNILEADLKGLIAPETLARLHARDSQAWKTGERVLFVPTFYAWGRVGA